MELLRTEYPKVRFIDRFRSPPDFYRTDPGLTHDVLKLFQPLSLKDLDQAALMDRQETKFIFLQKQIFSILPDLAKDYDVLEIRGKRTANYRTVYYDTADRQFFHQHLNGAGTRWKVRQRSYLDNEISFLEVKTKDNRRRTHKVRQPVEIARDWNPSGSDDLIRSLTPFSRADLVACLEISYSRTTLVKKDQAERVTIDHDLVFSNGFTTRVLPGLMIVEVKQDSFDPGSPLFSVLRSQAIRPTPFSKYCVGTVLVNPDIKHNRYKPIMLRIGKLIKGENHERTH
jgi:hypothetical protein